ncbi:unnamed protein product [Acanthoscelides obtectus]|uniref:C2H2-type domain-containing protein n=1 Tax=Acanthoscelides obtectus TaxID=200917 RepID=A0A9P0KM50_ACAOB|nr:unnamed protein product [Acanthoscelides obtectus]CAK1665153.1 Zinc finger protein ZFAT [Acanthoscelides obtectus]
MDAEVLATEEIVKIEMEDVEADTKLFELYNASWNLSFKRETDENTKNAVSVRIPVPEITDQINFKSEPEEEVKVESCLDNSEKYSVLEIMEEFVIKNECNDDDMFFNTTTEAVSNRIPVPEITDFLKSEPEVVKVESCLDNSEKYSVLEIKEEFIIKDEYNDDDMFVDTSIETVSNSVLKQQPVECKKLSRNLVYCHICDYSARYKYILVRHMKEHRNLNEHGSSYKHNTCIHCNAKFRSKRSLDDHVIKQHSDLVESVSSKTHKCSHCAYKSTNNGNYRRHMLKHSKTARASNYKFGIFICTHCNAKFKRKCTLYDHIIREHPDFISSLSCKLHHCTRCAYTTTIKSRLARHMLFKHSESVTIN